MTRKDKNTAMSRRIAGSWISTVLSISLVLLLVGAASLLLLNRKSVTDYFRENMQVSVILRDDAPEADAIDYCSSLESRPWVRSTRYISREEGVAQMAELLGDDFLDAFRSAPVPVSIDLTLKAEYVNADSLQKVTAALEADPLVGEVVSEISLIEKLNENLGKVSALIGIFVAVLLFISIVLIGNTVRLGVFARRFTIHTMQLVGATKGFIRAPFVGRSALQGLFAALLAILILLGGLTVLRGQFVQMFDIFTVSTLLQVMGIMVAAGILICVAVTWVLVGRLVGMSRDDLYSF
ncbi:MAG: permease-like cell division protein FtsX [Bacteroidales bacterium]|nr:permease-like cell division protein FtsX [Bacteroidales bacterium]